MKTEAEVLKEIRRVAQDKAYLLFRNNVGACKTSDGRLIRYGLMNETKQINENFKSADLIGVKPKKITQADVGKTIGQFVAFEVKREGWGKPKNKRELAQQNFLRMIERHGGIAKFVNDTKNIP